MKIKTIITIITIITFLPLTGLAFDFDNLFFDDLGIDSYISINKFDLIWSTDTYTPCEYQGRALPSPGSKVTVEAVVSVSGGNADSLKYSWFLEDIFQRSKSGYGKDSFYFYVNQRPGAYHTIRLQIFNESRSVFEEKSIKIPIVESELIVYSSNKNSYFSNRASKMSTILTGKEFSFIAKPYFFSIKKLTDLEFEWHFPGQEPIISSAYDASILDLTVSGKEDEEILESELWVSVKNKKEPRQGAYQTIKVLIY